MSDNLAEITTLEGQAVPIKSADEWAEKYLGKPEDELNLSAEEREKAVSTAQFMEEAGRYFSELVGGRQISPEDLKERYGGYEKVLKDRASGQTGERFIAELGGNCGIFAEALRRRVDEMPTVELVALLRVLKGGPENFDQIVKQSAEVHKRIADSHGLSFDQILTETEKDSNEPQIVGGELITPSAIRVGEISTGLAKERGWLAAISNAYGRENLSVADRQTNVQAIVDAAKTVGISKDIIQAHLGSLGINTVDRNEVESQEPGKLEEKPEVAEIDERRVRAYLTEISLQIAKVKDGSLKLEDFQATIDEAKKVGVPVDEIKAVLKARGVTVVEESMKSKEGLTLGLTSEEINTLSGIAYEFVRNQPAEETPFGQIPYEPIALMEERIKLKPEIGRRFDAHGIAKGGLKQQLESLNNLLTKGPDPDRSFHSTKLRLTEEEETASAGAIGAAGPYDTGSFIIIGNPDTPLRNGIAAVLVNEPYYGTLELLRERFPKVKFIRADQMDKELNQLILNESDKT